MKRIFLLAICFCLVATTALAAQPAYLSDLPKSHWAYEAVALLAKEGIIDGYPDKTFQGDKAMTRYEMAQVVVKAMANEKKANIAQRALIEKLASEFALDMNKIKSRLDKVEKEQAKIKISGELSEQYKSKKPSQLLTGNDRKTQSYGQEKFRLNIVGKVDDDSTVTLRIADPSPNAKMFKDSTHYKYGEFASAPQRLFDRMYGTTKVGQLQLSLGRQALVTDPEDIIVDSDFFSFDGLSAKWKAGNIADISYSRGRFARGLDSSAVFAFNGQAASQFQNVDVQTVALGFDLGKANLNFGYVEFEKSKKNSPNVRLMSYGFAQADYAFDNQFLIGVEAGNNGDAVSGGGFNSVKAVYGYRKLDRAGKQNFTIMRSNFNKNALYYAYSSLDCPDEGYSSDSFTNWDVSWRLALSKNLSLKLEYGDVKDHTTPNQSYQFWKLTTKWKF